MMSAAESSSPEPATAAVAAAAAAAAVTTPDTTSSNPISSSVGNTNTAMMTTMMNGSNNGQQQQVVDGGSNKSMMPSGGNTESVATAGGIDNGISTKVMTPTAKQPIGTAKPKQRHHHDHHHRQTLKSLPASRPQFHDVDDNVDDEGDDDNALNHRYSSSSSSAATLAISGGSSIDNDNAFTTEIARRSVARAALHLGIEGMEGIALDTLGSVLLGYLEMVGTTISTNVEISGRSSAHVNAYDALNVVSECTAPAAMQLGMGGGNSDGGVGRPDLSLISTADQSQPPPQENQHPQQGWEGLASFLFGPEWFSIRLRGEEEFERLDDNSAKNGSHAVTGDAVASDADGEKVVENNGNADASSSSAPPKKAVSGGKTFLPNRPTDVNYGSSSQPKTGKGKQLLPNMMGGEKTVTFSLDGQKSVDRDGIIDLAASGDNNGHSSTDDAESRWHAPYLHTVPAFPIVINTKAIANPHRLPGSKITLSLHDYSTEMEACVDYSPAKRPKKGAVVDDQVTKQKAAGLRDEMAERAMRAALRIPDDVYSTMGTVWGLIRTENNGSSSSSSSPPHTTNVKLQTITPAAAANATSKERLSSSPKPIPLSLKNSIVEEHDSSTTVPMPSYVPNFLPPFPSDYSPDTKKHDAMVTASMAAAPSVMGNIVSKLHNREKKRKSSSDISPAGEETKKPGVSNRDAVRRSVIGLRRSGVPSYWGSYCDADTINDWKQSSTNEQLTNDTLSNTLTDMSVQQGTTSSSSSMAAASTAPKKTDGVVAPLTRASGSRLAKILEGSMNVS